MPLPEPGFHFLARLEPCRIPIAFQQTLPGEQTAYFRVFQPFAVPGLIEHDVQQGVERRACLLDAAVVEIQADRKSVVEGKKGKLGGGPIFKKKKNKKESPYRRTHSNAQRTAHHFDNSACK